MLSQSNGEVQAVNEHFNPRDKSCLHVIAKSKNMVMVRSRLKTNYCHLF